VTHPLIRLWGRLPLIGRVMLFAGLALVVAGSLLLFVSIRAEAEFARQQITEELQSELESAQLALAESVVIGDFSSIELQLRQRAKKPDVRRLTFISTQGKTLTERDKETPPQAPRWFVRFLDLPAPEGRSTLNIGGRDYGQIVIEMTAQPAIDRLWSGFVDHLLILLVALAIDFSGILFVLTRGLKPLQAIEAGLQRIAAGELDTRIPLQGSPELRYTIETVNRMAESLQALANGLIDEQERLEVTLRSIGDGVISADHEGRVVFMNPVAEALTGWTLAEAKGRSLRQVFPIINERTRAEVKCPVGRALREGHIVGLANHTLLIARDGTERPIADSAAPIRHADGRIFGAVLVFRDQTEERRTLDNLRLAASVYEHSLDAVMITDASRHIVAVNPAFTRITGYAAGEVIGKTPRIRSSGRHDAAFYAAMWERIRETGQWQGELWNRRKDDGIYPEELSIVAVKDEEGAVTHYIGIFRDLTQVKAHEEQLRHLAHHDPLTGLPNRTLLADRLKVALSQAERGGRKLAVCYLDLDGFKPINDAHGHAIGDRLLIEISQRLAAAVRGGDTVARLGGDEFVLLLTDLADAQECERTLARILDIAARPCHVEGQALQVTASLGATLFPDDGADADTLLRHADQALYAAKEGGRNRYHLFDARQDGQVRSRRAQLERLQTALAHREFVLFYQPKVDMRQGRVIGAEALIRWQHPERGLLSPVEFLPQMAGSELEIALGEWVIDAALAQMARWREAGVDLAVAVNIAPAHLGRADFAARLESILDRHPGPPGRLQLEVVESAALEDIEHAAALMEDCRRLGVGFALDDFGTGYSSLLYLKRLPVDLVKIDQSFVRDLLTDPNDLAIAEAVIGLAEAFRIPVIAEGVETETIGAALIHLGCPLGQGYGIARPMPAEEMPAWIAGWRPPAAWAVQAGGGKQDEAVLTAAELDHRIWVERLQAWLDGAAAGPPELGHRACRFGRWYYGPGRVLYGGRPAFQAIDPLHRRVHELGAAIVAKHQAGEGAAAQADMAQLRDLRERLIDKLHALARAMDEAGDGEAGPADDSTAA
jgi:diguanylate cyclase (GGDEF)-like protein/PAS domain S-box-containing protein